MIRRTMDATRLNAIANHPDVRPWLGAGDLPIDLTGVLANPVNVGLLGDYGGFLCAAQDAGQYEVHSLFLPERPKGETITAMREGLAYMFLETDCTELVTQVPANNRRAAGLAALARFSPRFTKKNAWPVPDGAVDIAWMGLDLWAWVMSAPETVAAGEAFHLRLEAAKHAAGSALEIHADDETHDRVAGACYLMALAGNAVKGVTFYNRWARLAGYVQIAILSLQPTIIDIGDAIMTMRNHEPEVLLCR